MHCISKYTFSLNSTDFVPLSLLILLSLSGACTSWDLEPENFPEVITESGFSPGSSPTEVLVSGIIAGLLPDATVDAHGHIWSSIIDIPTIEDDVARTRFNRIGNSAFQSTLSDLTPGKTISFRAYAIFNDEVYYGEVFAYTPDELNFQLSTDSIVQISRTAVLSNVTIQTSIVNLPQQVTIKELGVSWGNHEAPTIEADNFTLDGLAILNNESEFTFQSTMENLATGRYFVRAYAIVGERVYYSNTFCFSLGDFWVKLDNFPGEPRNYGFSFELNGDGFFGGGGFVPNGPSQLENDFWRYQVETDSWFKLVDVPNNRSNIKSFVADERAFIGFGDLMDISYYDEFQEYNPGTGEWIKRTSFPTGPRGNPITFVLDDLIYVGTGEQDNGNTSNFLSDFWQYDPGKDEWTRKNDFPGGPREGGTSFVVGNKGYLLDRNVFWEYTPETDEWREKDYPGFFQNEVPIHLFTLKGKAYFPIVDREGNELTSNLLEYNPQDERWTTLSRIPSLLFSARFTINEVAYMGVDQFSTAFWAYYPIEPCN